MTHKEFQEALRRYRNDAVFNQLVNRFTSAINEGALAHGDIQQALDFILRYASARPRE